MLRAKRRKDGVGVSNLKKAEMHRCNNFGGWAAPSLDLATLLQARLRLWPVGACEWSMELGPNTLKPPNPVTSRRWLFQTSCPSITCASRSRSPPP